MAQHPNWKAELAEHRRQYEAGLYVPLEQVLKERGLDETAVESSRKRAARRAAKHRGTRRR